jgi:hypothetical protein
VVAKQILHAVDGIFKHFWKRHRANLGLAVTAVFESRRLGVAAIGRALPTRVDPKHAIKRVDRFLSNDRFDHRSAQEVLLRAVVGPRTRVYVSVDWTRIRDWWVLVASVVYRGRALPVLWSAIDYRRMYKSQNKFENAFFSWLASALPVGVRGVVIMDRGFDRLDLVQRLRTLGLSYVIRYGGKTHVEHRTYQGPVNKLLSRRGVITDLRGAMLRAENPVEARLVGVWDHGQAEPWLLVTDLDLPARQIVKIYGRRFQIEETFRDEKDSRFGLALGQLRMTQPLRLEKMLLVAALAHLLATLVGALAREYGLDRRYAARSLGTATRRVHSDFSLGLYYTRRLAWKISTLLKKLHADPVGLNWG